MSIPSEISRINDEVSTQTDLLLQIQTALEGKAGGGVEKYLVKFSKYSMAPYVKEVQIAYIDENGTMKIEDISSTIPAWSASGNEGDFQRVIMGGTILTVTVTATGGGGYGGSVSLHTLDGASISKADWVKGTPDKEGTSTYAIFINKDMSVRISAG